MKYGAPFALGLATAVAARAHAFLEHSNIGAGTKLSAAPKDLTLDFSEELVPRFSDVTVRDVQGHDVTSATDAVQGTQMSVPLRALKPGTYRVVWHAVSVDTHRTEGSFRFTVER
jgi:methionine-rich copper-binding protein CopC